MLAAYKDHFAQILAPHLGIPAKDLSELIQLAPEKVPGDLAFPTFQFAKQKSISPGELAQTLIHHLEKQPSDYFSQFIAVGPYVNAVINTNKIASDLIKQIQAQKADLGKGKV